MSVEWAGKSCDSLILVAFRARSSLMRGSSVMSCAKVYSRDLAIDARNPGPRPTVAEYRLCASIGPVAYTLRCLLSA